MTHNGVPERFDVLSIDIDGNDYWVWKALSARYKPRVAVLEYNAGVPIDVAVVMPYDPAYRWKGQKNVGQSLLAVRRISMERGYSLVYASAPKLYDPSAGNFTATGSMSTRSSSGPFQYRVCATGTLGLTA